MNKKPFWRRVNRGLVVSIVLLCILFIYVVTTQVMLMLEKREITGLVNDVRELMESTTVLSDKQVESLKSESSLLAEQNRIKGELSKIFVKDSKYFENAVSNFTDNIKQQTEGIQRVTQRDDGRKVDDSISIVQDKAHAYYQYLYNINGEYSEVTSEKIIKVEDAEQMLYLDISFKKVNGEWKIYSIVNASWSSIDQRIRRDG
ncbi:MAG: hypothetical protein PHH84_08045 [Oscillospiraceae bacterium]|nr:hypothetical protein [Oscillospiraceae bacterium]MDD4413909.1 hypothetical protein [Oscillospiraceae bacterium]